MRMEKKNKNGKKDIQRWNDKITQNGLEYVLRMVYSSVYYVCPLSQIQIKSTTLLCSSG